MSDRLRKRRYEEHVQDELVVTVSQPTLADDHAVQKQRTSLDVPQRSVIACHLPTHGILHFTTYDAYEAHFHREHVNRCVECTRNFPTAHLLDLHIAENHDPFFAARRDRGEGIYACLAADCDHLFATRHDRQEHSRVVHGFPSSFDWLVVDHGIDQRHSLLTD